MMEKTIFYKDYTPENGMELTWEPNFEIKCEVYGNIVQICANESGLLSLANHLITLSQQSVPNGYHLHLDSGNSLENGSCELIFSKAERMHI